MGDNDVQLSGTHTYQTDLLTGQYTFGYQFTVSNLHWLEFHNHFVTLDILSEPAFQLQPHSSMQPFQLAFNTNLLAATWPRIGPVIIQTALTSGGQFTDGQGGAATFGAGVDLSTVWVPELHVQGGFNVNIMQGAGGGLQTQISVPATMISGTIHFNWP
jgi:hypothetical protein